MIKPFIFSYPLHCSYILRSLDHTDDRSVSGRVRAYLAGLLIGKVAADIAVLKTSLGIDYGISEGLRFTVRKAENMKSEPLSSFTADARKLAEFIY